MPRPGSRTLVIALAAGLLLFGASCSGGGGGGSAPLAGLRATIVGSPDLNFLSTFGVIGLTFNISGAPGATYDVMVEYVPQGSPAGAQASQTSAGLAMTIGSPVTGPVGLLGLSLPGGSPLGGGGGEVTGADITLWWNAYSDLGFLQSDVTLRVTPVDPTQVGMPQGTSASSGAIAYSAPAANPSVPGSGPSGSAIGASAGGMDPTGNSGAPATATGNGRAGHTATNVRNGAAPQNSALNLLVTGGYTAATAPNAFDSMDRFTFVPSTTSSEFTATLQNSLTMTPATTQRVLHASSFFIDPSNGAIKVLATGGVDDCDPSASTLAAQVANATAEQSSGNVYAFSPTEQVIPVNNQMIGGARFDHSSTWAPCNQVVIIGGSSGLANPVATGSIEHYDPVSNSFFQPNNSQNQPASLGTGMERCGHESALMADGRIFIGGGYNPATLALLPCLIYDPISADVSVAAGGATQIMLVNHSVTRMANGWILIVGGQSPATQALSSVAYVYKPGDDSFSQITCEEARMMHAATLLGDKSVLITGGITNQGSGTGFTTSAQVFSIDSSFTSGFTSTSIFDAIAEARAEHTATAVDNGSVFIIGGRNDVGGGVNYLDSIEFFRFSNDVPSIASAMTQNYNATGFTIDINVDVTDADADGGYVIIRATGLSPVRACMTATITSPTSGANNHPNMEVGVGSYTFTWDFTADGFAAGDTVEIEIIPVGAVIGSSSKFTAVIN